MTLPGLTDVLPHLPPTSGSLAYNTYTGPVAGGSYVDPVFGSTIRRITGDRRPDDIYARNMRWNADGTKYSHLTQIVDTLTGQVTHSVPLGSFNGDAGFDPLDPNVFYYFSGSKLQKITLGPNGAKTEVTFLAAPATLTSPGGSINWWSADGQIFLILTGSTVRVYQMIGGAPVPFPTTFTFNVGNGWIGLSPSGNHVVAFSNNQGQSWKLDRLAHTIGPRIVFWDGLCGDHAVPISPSDGKDYLVVGNCINHDETWRVSVENNVLGFSESAQQTAPGNKLLKTENWQNERHFAAVAKGALRDWSFASMECGDCAGQPDNFNVTPVSNWPAYRSEIIAMNVMTGEIRRLAHHRSRSIPLDYGYQPRISVTWNGELVGWASNFNQSGGSDIYVLPFGDPTIAPPVPVDCVLSDWGPWSDWTPVSGSNPPLESRTHSRTVVTPPSNGGIACGPLSETETRPISVIPPTPVDCVLSTFGNSVTTLLAPGVVAITETRAIITPPANGGKACAFRTRITLQID